MSRTRIRRIAIVTHEFVPFRGGIGRVAEGLAAGAVEAGWYPVVVAPDYGEDTGERDRALPYPVRRFAGSHCSMVSFRKLTRFSRHLRRTLPELDADLIHGICPASQMALTALSRLHLLPAPYGLTIHGTELIRYRQEAFPRLWMLGGFRRPVGLASVSRAIQRRLHEGFRVPEERSFVAHPGIGDEWHQRARADRDAVRGGWGAGPDDFVVLTVARRVFEKGHDRVIRGIGALPESQRSRFLYVIAGTGPDTYARELETLAEEQQVRIRLLGELSDGGLVDACDGADLFAMLSRKTPTRLEGFGLTYLEAGSRGLPSIACRTGGVPEAVLDAETGVLLSPEPLPDEVARALLFFLRDDDGRRRMGRAAADRADRFTHRRHAEEVYGRFSELLDRQER